MEKDEDVLPKVQNEEDQPVEQNDFTTDFDLNSQLKETEVLEDYEEDYIISYKKNKIDDQIKDFLQQEKYDQILSDIIVERKKSLVVDFIDIHNFEGELEQKLLDNPKVFLKFFKQVLYEIDNIRGWDYFKESSYFDIRISNYVNKKEISKIRVDLNNQFITFRGLVQRQSEIRPYISKFYMRCPNCKTGRYASYPELECHRCEKIQRMIPVKDKHVYTDSVLIRVQELNEDLKGALPKYVECIVLGDIVDTIKAGSKITVTGFVGLREITNSMSIFMKYFVIVHVNNIEAIKSNDITAELEETQLTEDDIKKFEEFRKLPPQKKLERIVGSFAPHIYGHFIAKLVILLAIIGGGRIIVDGYIVRDRIHVILIGDPSISKTQLLKFGELITLGSMYASGRGTTATGLTAAAIKDKDGTFALQPGYLIFANGSVLWFDEADKPDKEVLSHLHQAMEEGRVSLAKGGQIATLNANTTVVSAANPKYSRYVKDMTVAENLDGMPDSFLTRFDFILLMLDVVNRELDRKVSRHIDKIVIDRVIPTYGVDIFTIPELVKYIEYVKKQDIDPDFSADARNAFEEFYLDFREKSTQDTIAISARYKQGMLRSGRALARLLLDTRVDLFHAETIINTMEQVFETVLKDEEGNYNIGQLEGKTKEKLEGVKIIIEICKTLAKAYSKDKISKNKILYSLSEDYKLTEKKAYALMEKAIDDGIIQTVSEGYVRFVHSE